MTASTAVRRRRPNMRRAVLLFPSGLTLGNLFFGIFAIITASRGDFRRAGIYVLVGGIWDALDGRVARATNAGTEFGEELDSLVDAISFGLAPAMIMYFAVLNRDGWDWIFAFLFAACAVLRLARFNVEQAGIAKTYFQGLPSPAAGITLASYYWFSQSWLYRYGAIGDLPWQEMMRFLMVGLALLMISPIPYPALPRTGFRSMRALASSILVFGSIALLLSKQLEYFFPLCLAYVVWGPARNLFSRLFERRQPTIPYDLSEGEDDEEDDGERDVALMVSAPKRPGARERDNGPREVSGRVVSTKLEDQGDRPSRSERPDRSARPERTEAERAARRAKRELREKREGRPERTPRPERGERPADPGAVAADTVPSYDSTAAVGPPSAASTGLPPQEGDASPVIAGDAAPVRKRKRRRRRGERKERGGTDSASGASDADSGDDTVGADSDSHADSVGRDSAERSPYASAAEQPATPIPSPVVPSQVVPSSPPARSSPPPSASPSSDVAE